MVMQKRLKGPSGTENKHDLCAERRLTIRVGPGTREKRTVDGVTTGVNRKSKRKRDQVR